MPSSVRMEYLTTVMGAFHGRVIAARLGAEGIVCELRGLNDGPYPLLSRIDVLVPSDQLAAADEVLLADAVEAAFDEQERTRSLDRPRGEPGGDGDRDETAQAAGEDEGGEDEGGEGEPTWARRGRVARLAVFAAVALLLVVAVIASFH